MSHFSPLCQLQLPIPQNRPVQLVPCFVGVHHTEIFGIICNKLSEIVTMKSLQGSQGPCVSKSSFNQHLSSLSIFSSPWLCCCCCTLSLDCTSLLLGSSLSSCCFGLQKMSKNKCDEQQICESDFYYRSEPSIVPLIFELKQNENWGGYDGIYSNLLTLW